MAHPTKIATCNYCGTRAALVLTGRTRHELACSGCGAPLHDLKSLPLEPSRKKTRQTREYGISHAPSPKKSKPQRKRKKSKKKSRMRGFFEEAFDVLEDIFD
ncbi:hypothetical protein AIOL_000091 [Candidatus Rhodobacter oscarellae]|uniref:Uncharacterized protein n=1 Tax=Candidatus Rhodobacter oscarellae TaxID=1675527 RepID=A0A0J9EAY8_9RHOB|nr:hypothetical protein [Candidatus Rhodobacter lobularis]KMW59942.1 hypothetical protein AIOL_000091 [Candidatus Rhodobacter lobularis]